MVKESQSSMKIELKQIVINGAQTHECAEQLHES